MRKKREENVQSTSDKSVFDLSTRELRNEIRRRTAEVNIRIAQYRESQKTYSEGEQKFIERTIESLKRATASEKIRTVKKDGKKKVVHTGNFYIPSGSKGEIGLGLSYKSKKELERQLAALRRFEKNDISTPTGKEEWSDKMRRQYDTFRNRYNPNMSESEYESMIDTMNVVKESLKDYGYEDKGASLARTYAKANVQGRRKFVKYVEQAKKESSGRTVEDIIDTLTSILRKNGEI